MEERRPGPYELAEHRAAVPLWVQEPAVRARAVRSGPSQERTTETRSTRRRPARKARKARKKEPPLCDLRVSVVKSEHEIDRIVRELEEEGIL